MKKAFSFVAISVTSLFFAQTFDSKKLDEYFNALEENHKVMGSFAIAKDDQIIYTKSLGFADVESKSRPNENTEYRIASISKMYTAVLVLKAVEEKKINLSDKLSQYFPQVKNADKITIEQVLQHRSGIHNFTDDRDYWNYNTKPKLEGEMLAKIVNGGSDFEPGSKYSYSNSNYLLLGFILQKLYKKSYATLLDEKIAKPLGLVHTKVGTKILPKNNVANSYFYKDYKYEKQVETDMSVSLGAGNLVSTPSEMLKFVIALQNGKLINAESLAKMKDFKDHYGLGLAEVPFNDNLGFGHNGGIDDFQSVLYYFPDGEVSIAGITNQSNYDNNDISIKMLSAAYSLPITIPNFKVVELSEAELRPFVGVYASPEFPLKISIFLENGKLMGQATGQGAFPLEATSKNSFKFDQAGITMEFDSEKSEMKYLQMGQNVIFKKEQM